MDLEFQVNSVLPEEITKITYAFNIPGLQADQHTYRTFQQQLCNVIDSLGLESASAQGLSNIATTSEKLRNTPGHTLYLLKDAQGNGGKGEAIGMLKVGRKKLFLYDPQSCLHEVEPLSVLDFYTKTNRQRHGYGKKLFDYMLQDMRVDTPHELAVDGPSPKLKNFMMKHYGVELIEQYYKFSISPKFFEIHALANGKPSTTGRITPEPERPVGRFAAVQPRSTVGAIIHGNKSVQDHCESYDWVVTDEPQEGGAMEVTSNGNAGDAGAGLAIKCERQPSVERPCTLKVSAPAPLDHALISAPSSPRPPLSTTSERRDSQLTDRGFFDVKFYHNKLW